MTEPIARIEAALARLGADHQPPPGWEDRVLAATATRRRRWWWWVPIPVAVLAVIAIVVASPGTPGLSPPELAVTVTRGNEDLYRAPSMIVGGVMTAVARRGGPHRAIWIYRDGRLVMACPRDPGCQRADDGLVAEHKLISVGPYVIVALASSSALPAPAGSYDEDVAGAERAGAKVARHPVNVH